MSVWILNFILPKGQKGKRTLINVNGPDSEATGRQAPSLTHLAINVAEAT